MRKPQTDPRLLANARHMRREPTPAERILWTQLRGRRLAEIKFRRQVPVGKYIADFFSDAAKMIVELDGQTHFGNEENDRIRQDWFERQGFVVLRFWNSQIYEQGESVLRKIWVECQARIPSPPGRGRTERSESRVRAERSDCK